MTGMLLALSPQDEATAREALKLIEVDYDVLAHVTDADAAMAADAPDSE